jgi:uncharacterized membrane protein
MPAFLDFVPARSRSHINQHSKDQTMQRNIFTTRSARQARRAMFDVIGAVILASASVALLLAYFDVLTKG